METVNIKMLRMYDDVKLPVKRDIDAGYDIYANFEEDYIVIMPHESKLIPTGFKTIIPSTHYAQIFERGSSGVQNLKFNAGVIDSGFRGEWKVCLYNGNDEPYADFIIGTSGTDIVLNSADVALGSSQKLDSIILKPYRFRGGQCLTRHQTRITSYLILNNQLHHTIVTIWY